MFNEQTIFANHLELFKKASIVWLCVGLFGCVKKSTYESLQAQHATSLKTLDELKIKLITNEVQRDQLTKEKDKLSKDLTLANNKNAQLLSDRSALQTSVADMQNALKEQARRQAEVEARIASFKALLDRFRPLIDTGKLKVKIVEGRMVLVLATDILFDKGSAELSEEGRIAIGDVATALASFPNRSFQVEGHTDNDPISTRRYPSNWDLAADRALNVVKAMVESGLPATQISGSSYGEFKPIASNENDEDKAQNRRIEIVIVPDLSKLPGFDELQRIQPE